MSAMGTLYGELTGNTNGANGAEFVILLTGENGDKVFESTWDNRKLFLAVFASLARPESEELTILENEIATMFYGMLPDDVYLSRVHHA